MTDPKPCPHLVAVAKSGFWKTGTQTKKEQMCKITRVQELLSPHVTLDLKMRCPMHELSIETGKFLFK